MIWEKYKETFDKGHRYFFTTVPCPGCQSQEELILQGSDVLRHRQGALMQEAFPYISADDRERLMSGYCGSCFDDLWKEEE